MPTFLEIITRARIAAQGKGFDPHASPVLDGATLTAESIFPNALRYAVRKTLGSGENAGDLSLNHTIALSAGVGTLPSGVLPEFLRSRSHLPAIASASWLDYPDYVRPRLDSLIKYYSANNGQFFYSDGAAGSVVLNTPSYPSVPSDPNAAITMSAKLADNLVATIAAVLTGELPFAALSEERP